MTNLTGVSGTGTLKTCGCAQCLQATSKPQAAVTDYVSSGTGSAAAAFSLYSGNKWSGSLASTTVTFKFLDSVPTYYSPYAQERVGMTSFSAAMKDATVQILKQLESFTNLHFTQTTGTATSQMTFAQAYLQPGVGAWAYYPSQTNQLGGDVWTNRMYADTQNVTPGGYGFYTLMHEIGHAIGLQHSFTAGLTGAENTSRYTVMAYDWSPFFSTTYMIYDISALQKIYGANMTYKTGNDVYNLTGNNAFTIWDAGGTDTLNAATRTDAVTLDLRDGKYSSVGKVENVGIAYNAIIENATGGSGNDKLIGNQVANILIGNAGNDVFVGGAGNDTMNGGAGADLAVYAGAIKNFVIKLIDAVTLTIQDMVGSDGKDTLTQIEKVEFANIMYSFEQLASYAATGTLRTSTTNQAFTATGDNAFTASLNSNLLGTDKYAGTIFNYAGNTTPLLQADRGTVDGMADLTLKALTKTGAAVGAVSISDMVVQSLHTVDIRSVTVKDTTDARALYLDLDGTHKAAISTGAGSDVIDIQSVAPSTVVSTYTVYSGAGHDDVFLSGGAKNLSALIDTGDGDDLVHLLISGASTIRGGNGNDMIYGGSGIDKISGDAGNDMLFGGAGNDILSGGLGLDVLNGGAGADTLSGGGGRDLFVFSSTPTATSMDIITDFNVREDKLDISDLLYQYNSETMAIANFVKVTATAGHTFISVDQNGATGGANFVKVADLINVGGQDLNAMIQKGMLIVS